MLVVEGVSMVEGAFMKARRDGTEAILGEVAKRQLTTLISFNILKDNS